MGSARVLPARLRVHEVCSSVPDGDGGGEDGLCDGGAPSVFGRLKFILINPHGLVCDVIPGAARPSSMSSFPPGADRFGVAA